MNKLLLNLVIDVLTALLLLVMAATGYVLWFVLPPGTNRTHMLWGLLRHEWGTVHAAASIGLTTFVVVHVALHWRWLATNLLRRVGAANAYQRHPCAVSLALLAAVLVPSALFATLASLGVRPMDTPLHPADAPRTTSARAVQQPANMHQDRSALRTAAGEVLAARCASCHGAQRTEGGVRADTVEALLGERGGTRWVTPGDAQSSSLFRVLTSDATRPPRVRAHLLDDEDLGALRRWVASLTEEPSGP